MKASEKKKPIETLPDGIWEGSPPESKKEKDNLLTTDLQGNGYPLQKSEEQSK